jgi:hypothetical protein
MKRKSLLLVVSFLGVLALAAGLFLANSPTLEAQEGDPADAVGEPGTFLTGLFDAWANSPHADYTSEAFRHWDEDGEVEVACAACHSTPGHLDFLGADGSTPGVVDAPSTTLSVVNCEACHNQVAANQTMVTFPSGITIEGIDTDSARCMDCHQGRNSGLSVANAIEEAGLTESPNEVNAEFGFINVHYYPAAATIYGSEVQSGFQFPGNTYFPRNTHVEGYSSCDSCHSPHSLELKVGECATCHEGADTIEGVREIRAVSSMVDYDGDGDMTEGIRGELETMEEILYMAIQTYATEVVGTGIVYGSGYPYFFTDTNGDGEPGEDETIFPNKYATFTPLLLQATYNYQVVHKDPGGYSHNADYHIQLMYDTIMALNAELGDSAMDVTMLTRDSYGHFEYTGEAFRHWDEDGEVSGSCSKCHTAEGLPFFLENGVTIAFEPSTGLACETCHAGAAEGDFSVFMIETVAFPSGAELSYGEESANNICLECHQGRSSGVTIANALANAGVGADEVSEALRFSNPHYFATGASWFGSDANGAYEFEGMEYNTSWEHTRRFDECSDCHNPHSAQVVYEECSDCHENVEGPEDLSAIRAHPDDKDPVDIDGDGDVEEPIMAEMATLEEALYAAIQTYAAETIGTPIGEGAGYPYYFIDTNGDGMIDAEEGQRSNAYATWTPTLLQAVYNYQFVTHAAGGYSHNPDYLMQVMYDTLAVIGGEEAVASFNRPEVVMNED